ncbi:MAG TPA: hypothetical protein VGB03_03445 [Acidimicrobiales bacterium]
MNEDASAWAAACIVLVWLWCLAAFVPALATARWRRVEGPLHGTGIVALGLFVAFWLSLLGDDSDAAGFVAAPFAVAALVAWVMRRYALASLALWAMAVVVVASGYGYMAFYGPAPLGVVAGVTALSLVGRGRVA